MDRVIVDFINMNSGEREELEIPLSIAACDLVHALNSAYHLGLNRDNIQDHYLCSENPIAFLRGEKTLADFGIRNGSVIIYKR